MDFDVGLLLFLFLFFVLPLIQRVLGGAKQAPPRGGPPNQRQPGVPPAGAEGRARLPDGARTGTPDRADTGEPARAEPERAADLIPDNLWEILTGERRSRASSQRQRSPVPEPDHEAEAEWGDGEGVWQHEERVEQIPESDEKDPYQRSDPLEAPRRREHGETARTTTTTPTPAPISASETVSQPAAPRPSPYATLDATARPPSGARPRTPDVSRRRMAPLLSNRSDLKRAFVLREVLGPPKALE